MQGCLHGAQRVTRFHRQLDHDGYAGDGLDHPRGTEDETLEIVNAIACHRDAGRVEVQFERIRPCVLQAEGLHRPVLAPVHRAGHRVAKVPDRDPQAHGTGNLLPQTCDRLHVLIERGVGVLRRLPEGVNLRGSATREHVLCGR